MIGLPFYNHWAAITFTNIPHAVHIAANEQKNYVILVHTILLLLLTENTIP